MVGAASHAVHQRHGPVAGEVELEDSRSCENSDGDSTVGIGLGIGVAVAVDIGACGKA